TVRLWDVAAAKGRATLRGPGSSIESLAFSPDGRTLAAGSGDGWLWLWDVAAAKPRPASFAPRVSGKMEWLSEISDGSVLVQGTEDGLLKSWDLPSGKETHRFPECQDISWAALSADGKALRSVNWTGSGEAKIWDTATQKERFGTDKVRTDALSADGTMWAVA